MLAGYFAKNSSIMRSGSATPISTEVRTFWNSTHSASWLMVMGLISRSNATRAS